MADENVIEAVARSRSGKGGARATRRAGQVPGIVYGEAHDNALIAVAPQRLMVALRRPGFFNTLFDLRVDGKAERVLPRDVQFDVVNDRPIHVDFMRVRADMRLTVSIPVRFINDLESPGLKRGGVLNIVAHEIAVQARADSLPREIVVDLTGLNIGDSVHMSNIVLPEGVTAAMGERDATVATVVPPTTAVVTTPVAATAEAGAAAAAAAPGAAAPAAGAVKAKAPGT